MLRLSVLAASAALLAAAAAGAFAPGPASEQPDLFVSPLSVAEDYDPGETLEFSADFVNFGPVAAGSFHVRFLLNGADLGTEEVGGLDPDERLTLHSRSWVTKVGTWTIEAVADVFSEVAESNEGNNAAVATFTVTTKPDLVVTDVAWSPDPVRMGDLVRVRATVANTGVADAGPFNVSVRGQLVGVGGLAAGASVEVAAPEPFLASSSETVWADADWNNDVRESDEANNDRGEAMAVASAPLASASADGDAYGFVAVSGTGRAQGVVAVSGTGNAQGTLAAVSGAGDAYARYAAVSGTGTPHACVSWSLCVVAAVAGDAVCPDGRTCVAASVLGDVEGSVPLGVGGTCNGVRCVAVEPASGAEGYWAAASGEGDAHARVASVAARGTATCAFPLPVPGCLAVAGDGDASSCPQWSNSSQVCTGAAVAGTGSASGLVAASGTGDAACRPAAPDGNTSQAACGLVAVSGTGDARARFLAVSGTGHASGGPFSVSACDRLGACLDPV